eukprot:2938056-Ditylum_brightwellii.AAC.1
MNPATLNIDILNVDITSRGGLVKVLQVIADVPNVQKNQVHCCNNPCASHTVNLGTGAIQLKLLVAVQPQRLKQMET